MTRVSQASHAGELQIRATTRDSNSSDARNPRQCLSPRFHFLFRSRHESRKGLFKSEGHLIPKDVVCGCLTSVCLSGQSRSDVRANQMRSWAADLSGCVWRQGGYPSND